MILGGSRTRGTSGALQKWHVQKDVEGFYHVAAAFLIQIACVTPKNQCSNIAGFRASVLYTKLRSRRKKKTEVASVASQNGPTTSHSVFVCLAASCGTSSKSHWKSSADSVPWLSIQCVISIKGCLPSRIVQPITSDDWTFFCYGQHQVELNSFLSKETISDHNIKHLKHEVQNNKAHHCWRWVPCPMPFG